MKQATARAAANWRRVYAMPEQMGTAKWPTFGVASRSIVSHRCGRGDTLRRPCMHSPDLAMGMLHDAWPFDLHRALTVDVAY